MDDEQKKNMIWLSIMILISVFGILFMVNYETGFICKTKILFSSDSYCYKQSDPMSNISNGYYDWQIGSYKQDEADSLARAEVRRLRQIEIDKQQQCYDEGYFVNESFNISDYGLNCRKIDYLNDHLMDNFEQKDVGYISGRSSGLFSSGYVNGKMYQYINDRVLATGMLVQNINYQIDCNDIKHDEKIDYYTEEEFVMFYVEECIA